MSRMDEVAKALTAQQLYDKGVELRDSGNKHLRIPMPDAAKEYFIKAAEKGHAGAKEALFLQSEEFDRLIAATKEFWDECDYMGNPGATEEETNELNRHCIKHYQNPAPQGYIEFLRKLNGFSYKLFDIYSCKKAIEKNRGDPHFIIGEDRNSVCVYVYENGNYMTFNTTDFDFFDDVPEDYEPFETYDSFSDMFKTLLMFELPADKLQKAYPDLKGWI